jgi:hypothetical protein
LARHAAPRLAPPSPAAPCPARPRQAPPSRGKATFIKDKRRWQLCSRASTTLEKIKSGELPELSIGGTGMRVNLE